MSLRDVERVIYLEPVEELLRLLIYKAAYQAYDCRIRQTDRVTARRYAHEATND